MDATISEWPVTLIQSLFFVRSAQIWLESLSISSVHLQFAGQITGMVLSVLSAIGTPKIHSEQFSTANASHYAWWARQAASYLNQFIEQDLMLILLWFSLAGSCAICDDNPIVMPVHLYTYIVHFVMTYKPLTSEIKNIWNAVSLTSSRVCKLQRSMFEAM